MSKTVRSLLVIVGLLLFAVGFLVGQGRRSKFNKYSGPATAMDIGVLRANAVMKTSMSIDIPLIYYNYSCDCFI